MRSSSNTPSYLTSCCHLQVHAGDCSRCELSPEQGGCKCDSNCDCVGGGGGGGKCDKCALSPEQGGCKCDSNCDCADGGGGGGGKCDQCALSPEQGGCKCDSNCDCAGGGGGGGKCDKCALSPEQGGCKCDSNCDCAGAGGGGGKCDKCALSADQGGCKCDGNCDCTDSLEVRLELGAGKVWVTRSFYSDLIRNANFQRVNQGASTQEVQDGDGNTLSFVVSATGDKNLDAVIAGFTSQGDKLGAALADEYFTNIIADGFDHMPGSLVYTAYLGNRVAAQYSIFRTASVPPPPGSCQGDLAQKGAIVGAIAAGLGIAAVVFPPAGVTAALATGGAAGAGAGAAAATAIRAFSC